MKKFKEGDIIIFNYYKCNDIRSLKKFHNEIAVISKILIFSDNVNYIQWKWCNKSMQPYLSSAYENSTFMNCFEILTTDLSEKDLVSVNNLISL